MTDGEWVPPEKTYWPTQREVREIIQAIIRHIDQTPDWAPKPTVPKVETPDETWKGWGR